MDAASRLHWRLARIESFDRDQAPASQLLGELRALVREAEALAHTDVDQRACSVVADFGRGRQE